MKYCLLPLFTALLFMACTKDRDTECLDGTIEYMGDPAADGLGWVLRTEPESPRYFVLDHLGEDYQVAGLAVHACIYNTGHKATCMCAAPPDVYRVASMRQR